MATHRWTLRIARAASEAKANVFVRKHQFSVGAPIHFDDQYPWITALEYALGALGAELVNGLAELARYRRIEIDHLEAVVHGELNNPLVQAGVVGAEGHPGIEWVSVRVFVGSLEDEAVVRALWKEVLERSVLARTLKDSVRLELTMKTT